MFLKLKERKKEKKKTTMSHTKKQLRPEKQHWQFFKAYHFTYLFLEQGGGEVGRDESGTNHMLINQG